MKKLFESVISRRLLIAVFLIAALGLTVSCAKKEPGEIKIGVITPLTGEGASYGEATKRGVDLAAEEINQKGRMAIADLLYSEVIPSRA